MFRFLVFLHIVAVVVGIGAVFLNGMYANISMKRRGAEGAAISEANYDVSSVAEKFIYAIPVFGVLAVLANDGIEFSQLWIWLSIVLYVVAVGLSHAVVIPGHRRLNELGRIMASGEGGAGEDAEMTALGKRMAPAGMALNLLAVVLIGLMVWQPGI